MTDIPERKPLLRRLASSVLKIGLTVAVIGAAALSSLTIQDMIAGRAAIPDAPPPAPPLAVRTAELALEQGYDVRRRFAGQVEAPQTAALSFEEGGTLHSLSVREGANVRQGDVLATLDMRLLEAERVRLAARKAALEAETELARRTNARQAELRERGFATDQAVDDTSLTMARLEAGIAEIDASLVALDVRLEKAQLRAPFDGVVGTRWLDEGAFVAPGAPVLTLLEDGPLRVRVGVDPRLAADLAPGRAATVEADGAAFPVRLAQIAPDLDLATRSRLLFFTLAPEGAPPAGTTVELTLSEHVDATGAWLPLSALRQGPQGTWQIVTVTEVETAGAGPGRATAGVEAVEIIASEGDRAFVRGTFADGTRFLTDGTHRVVVGESVVVEGLAPGETDQ